jgi:undecaprenyl-diphosphatase
MNLWYAILLGIIQGLTEFLPISSTAHLTLVGKLLGLIDPIRPESWTAFIAIMQLGTVAAVTIYFFNDLVSITSHFIRDLTKRTSGHPWSAHSHLGFKIFIGSIPVVAAGLTFQKVIEGAFTKEIVTIATSMISLAILLLIAEKVGKRNREQHQTRWYDALIIGIAQAIALIPGSSRSGTTITAGLFIGLTRETAARFSFLLSIPAVVGSGFFELYVVRHQINELGFLPLFVATVVSGIVGYGTIFFLLKYLRSHTTYLFIWYRIVLGVLLWLMLIFHLL